MFLNYHRNFVSFTYFYIWIMLMEIYKRREEPFKWKFLIYFWLFSLLSIHKTIHFKILTETVAARARVTLIVCLCFFLVSLYSSPIWVSSLDLSFMEFRSFSLIFYGKWLSLSLCAKRKHRGERIGGAVLSLQCWWCSSAKYCTSRSGCGSSSR